jgi:hypothetical protein
MLEKYETLLWLGTWLQAKAELDLAVAEGIRTDDYREELAGYPGLMDVVQAGPLYAPEIMAAFRSGDLHDQPTPDGNAPPPERGTHWGRLATEHPAESAMIANAARLIEQLREASSDRVARHIAQSPELNRLQAAIHGLPRRVCPVCGGIRMVDSGRISPLAEEYLAFTVSDGGNALDPGEGPSLLDFGWVCDCCGFEEADEPQEPDGRWYRWDAQAPAIPTRIFRRFTKVRELAMVGKAPDEAREWYVLVDGTWYGIPEDRLQTRLSAPED